MAAVRPCSFSLRGAALSGALLLAMAGCASKGTLLPHAGLRLFTEDSTPQIVDAGVQAVTTKEAIVIPASDTPVMSSWCEYLREDTAAQTAIMRSPSLSGSINNEAQSSLSLKLSVSDQIKASTLEQSAEAKCRRDAAERGLQKLVFVSPQGLTSAGYRAKARAIGKQEKDIKALRRQISAALERGEIDHERAATLKVLADRILAEAEEARSQAERRLATDVGTTGSASVLAQELLAAESDLEDLNSRMRTLDAMDVSASVGWNDDVDSGGFSSNEDSFSGKVSFSWKLGSALPSRFAHEERAKEAKLRAIAEGEGGALWQVSILRRAHERALSGLSGQRRKLDDAIAEAEGLLSNLTSVDNPEFRAARLQARLQLIALNADRAAVSGSIDEIEANMKRLALG